MTTMITTTKLGLYFVCYAMCYRFVNGQQDFNADQSSETDGGLGNFGTNTGVDNSRFLQFEDFLSNLRTSTSAPSSRTTTGAQTSDDSFNDFQLGNFNSQFRNFGGRPDSSRSFGQTSSFDSGEQFRSDSDSGITRNSGQRTDENTRTRSPTFADRNDDANNFDNFGSQFSNFNGFSSGSRQRGSNSAVRSTASPRSDDDSGASSFSFFSRSFNN
ncbi:dentin sialophosphoprotein-like [Agrilus planipennis]|uniref:Dentin sialophosphoprotein-like n=1 Tax=Agrilus planipennis TaxID=224129 RepID=A0A1W4WG74_AGRPL|nr:dentin sialophosphoprotein-like [Agrilus planipennis]